LPTITGTANLRDGILLMVSLMADRPCTPDCFAETQITAQNGRFGRGVGGASLGAQSLSI
jgi:hypothetical protein